MLVLRIHICTKFILQKMSLVSSYCYEVLLIRAINIYLIFTNLGTETLKPCCICPTSEVKRQFLYSKKKKNRTEPCDMLVTKHGGKLSAHWNVAEGMFPVLTHRSVVKNSWS